MPSTKWLRLLLLLLVPLLLPTSTVPSFCNWQPCQFQAIIEGAAKHVDMTEDHRMRIHEADAAEFVKHEVCHLWFELQLSGVGCSLTCDAGPPEGCGTVQHQQHSLETTEITSCDVPLPCTMHSAVLEGKTLPGFTCSLDIHCNGTLAMLQELNACHARTSV